MIPKTSALLLLCFPSLILAQDCAEIEDDEKRLACYDARQKPSSSTTSTAESEPSPAVAGNGENRIQPDSASPARAAESAEEFGQRESVDTPKEFIEATIVEVIESGNVHYLKLDNGQVWREIGDTPLRFSEGKGVTITEGILNSYDLKMEGHNKIVKVKRVR